MFSFCSHEVKRDPRVLHRGFGQLSPILFRVGWRCVIVLSGTRGGLGKWSAG